MSIFIMSRCKPIQTTPTQKAVLMALADNANDDGVCWPRIDTISEATCYSERTVQRAIVELESKGWITCEKRPGRSNIYTIYPDNATKLAPKDTQLDSTRNQKEVTECQECHNDRGDTLSAKGCHCDTLGVTQCHLGGDTLTPITVIEPSFNSNEPSLGIETKKSPQSKKASSLPADFQPTEKHRELSNELGVDLKIEFEKFCDYARATGKTYKDWSAALNNWIRNSARFWTKKQSIKPRQITPATSEIPPGWR